jgi:putative ABC transport system ATP-binding protein
MPAANPLNLDRPESLPAAVELDQVRFGYPGEPDILRIPALRIARGERVFLYGPSGSGKTTLLGILAGVLGTSAGSVRVLGRDLTTLSPRQCDAFRGAHIGYIFQLFNLITYLNVEDNILLPCRLHQARRARLSGQSLSAAALAIATRLGIAALLQQRVTHLSVGEQQRVAAARALIGTPEIILADEPTSALDSDHRQRFLELLFDCAEEAGSTLIFVSHDRALMPLFHRAIALPEMNDPQRL